MGFIVTCLGSLNLVLGFVNIVAQVIYLTYENQDDPSSDSTTSPPTLVTVDLYAGIWCGVVYILSGIVTIKFDSAVEKKRCFSN